MCFQFNCYFRGYFSPFYDFLKKRFKNKIKILIYYCFTGVLYLLNTKALIHIKFFSGLNVISNLSTTRQAAINRIQPPTIYQPPPIYQPPGRDPAPVQPPAATADDIDPDLFRIRAMRARHSSPTSHSRFFPYSDVNF